MIKLNELIKLCKYSVTLTVNNHRDFYESVEQYIDNINKTLEDKEEIEPEIYSKMKELDTIVELQFYPETAGGFYKVYHYDVELAIDEALEIIKQ